MNTEQITVSSNGVIFQVIFDGEHPSKEDMDKLLIGFEKGPITGNGIGKWAEKDMIYSQDKQTVSLFSLAEQNINAWLCIGLCYRDMHTLEKRYNKLINQGKKKKANKCLSILNELRKKLTHYKQKLTELLEKEILSRPGDRPRY